MNTTDSDPLFRHFRSRRTWLPILLSLLALSAPEFRLLAGPQPRPAVDAYGDPLPDGALARLGTMRWNHGEGLRHLFIAPDGKTIYSEGGGLLRVWDAVTGVERECLAWDRGGDDIPNGVENLILTADGKKLVSLRHGSFGDDNDTVRVWDLDQKKEIRKLSLPIERRQWSVDRRNALSADGRLGAINLPTEMRIFDLTTGREHYKLAKGGKEIEDVVFAGNRLVTADAKQKIDVWDAQTGKPIRQFAHDAPFRVLAASRDGHWLATSEASRIDILHIWDLSTGKLKRTLAAPPNQAFGGMTSFSTDSKRLLTWWAYEHGSTEFALWDVETGARIRELPAVDANSNLVGLAPHSTNVGSMDGSRIVLGNKLGRFDVWDVKSGRRLSAKGCGDAWASTLAFSKGGDRLVLLNFPHFEFRGNPFLSSWETATCQRTASFELLPSTVDSDLLEFFASPRSAPILDVSSDGRFALSYCLEKRKVRALLWEVAQQRRLHTLKTSYWISAFAPDCSQLATWEFGKESVIRLWEVQSGREIRSFRANVAWKREPRAGIEQPRSAIIQPHLSFTADGKTLLAVDKKIGGYEVASGKELFSWSMKRLPNKLDHRESPQRGGEGDDAENWQGWLGITSSPDGALVAALLIGPQWPMGERIALFDARTGKLLRRWSDSDELSGRWFESLCFSHDSQLLATPDGNVIHLWEAATGKEIRTFRGHRGNIAFLAFSHDDRRLASASEDSTVLLWDMTGQPAKPATLTEEKLKECWNDLAGEDAARAHRAVWTLIRASRESIPFLKTNLHPVQSVGREQIDRWIQDLDADTFEVRQIAASELTKLGDLAEQALRRALAEKPTLEKRRRIESLLAKLDPDTPSGERLQALRAMRVLGQADTPEPRQLLRDLAGGAEGAWLTRQAQGALARLNPSAP